MKRNNIEANGKKISKFYFEPIANQKDKYQCKICPLVQRVQAPTSGYANLLSHVLSSHPNYEAEMKLSKEAKIEGLWLLT